MSPGRTAASLLDDRLRRDSASPLVTFYDDATGERVELSAATFANWVAKSANLLVDGLGLGPGDVARVALPLHWQSLVAVAASWAAGLAVDLDGSAPAHTVAFVTEGDTVETDAADVIALSLLPMGGRLAAAAPGVVDFAAEVLAHGDRFVGTGPGPADLAITGATHAELAAEAVAAATDERRLFAPAGDPALRRDLLVSAYLAPLAGGGSVVLCRHADPEALPRRVQTERAVPA